MKTIDRNFPIQNNSSYCAREICCGKSPENFHANESIIRGNAIRYLIDRLLAKAVRFAYCNSEFGTYRVQTGRLFHINV